VILQVEKVIREFPGIADVGVFGIPNHNDQEHVAAAVVKEANQVLNIKKLLTHVESSLEPYKHLHGGLFVVDSLPKNPQGKLLRRCLIEMITE